MRFAPELTNGTPPFGRFFVETISRYDEAVVTPAITMSFVKCLTCGRFLRVHGRQTVLVDSAFTQNVWSTICLMVDISYRIPVILLDKDSCSG
jgi:hypothetical protein